MLLCFMHVALDCLCERVLSIGCVCMILGPSRLLFLALACLLPPSQCCRLKLSCTHLYSRPSGMAQAALRCGPGLTGCARPSASGPPCLSPGGGTLAALWSAKKPRSVCDTSLGMSEPSAASMGANGGGAALVLALMRPRSAAPAARLLLPRALGGRNSSCTARMPVSSLLMVD